MNDLKFYQNLAFKWEQYKQYFLSDKDEEDVGRHKLTFYTASIVTENLLRQVQEEKNRFEDKLDFIEYKKATEEMLTSGAKFYRREGSFVWVLSIGAVNDYAVYVLEDCSDFETVYRHGSKVTRMEAMRIFPDITSHLLFRE